MSFLRLIYWTSLLGGWSAFVAWLVTELVFGRWIDPSRSSDFVAAILVVLMSATVAAAIGGAIGGASAFANPHWLNVVKRVLPGLAGGFVVGAIGMSPGLILAFVKTPVVVELFVELFIRIICLTFVGVGIGVIEGLCERSWKKTRNGLIGGLVGGFLGGLFFPLISWLIGSVSGRAFAFVLLGVCIGLFIGLAQVVLKEAWLTVEEGFRPGRQMILTQDLFTMGTSEKSNFIFIAYGAKGVEPLHLRISKQLDGGYLLEDNQSRGGTLLNGAKITEPTVLRDGDAIQFGINVVRFNEVLSQGEGGKRPPAAVTKAPPQPALPTAASTAKAPTQSTAVQPKPAAAVRPAPKPVVPAEPAKPQEGRCPICDKKIVGIPGERRCRACFTTF